MVGRKINRDTVMEEVAGCSEPQAEPEAEEPEKVYGKPREEEPTDKVTAAKKKFRYQIPILSLPEIDDTISKLLGTMVSVSFQTMLQASLRLLKGLRQLLTRRRVEIGDNPELPEGEREEEAPQEVANLQRSRGDLEDLEKAFVDIRLSLPDREGDEVMRSPPGTKLSFHALPVGKLKIQIGTHHTDALVDGGAEITLIRRDFATITGCTVNKEVTGSIRGAGGEIPFAGYILDARDNLSGFVETVALKKKTGRSVANWIEDFYLRHPFVRRFIADNETEFVNQEVLGMLKRLCIPIKLMEPYHPEANASVERGHRTLKNTIAKLATDHLGNWPRYLKQAVFAENMTSKRTTGCISAELWYGREIEFPVEALVPTWNRLDDDPQMTTEELIEARCQQILKNEEVMEDIANRVLDSRMRDKASEGGKEKAEVEEGGNADTGDKVQVFDEEGANRGKRRETWHVESEGGQDMRDEAQEGEERRESPLKGRSGHDSCEGYGTGTEIFFTYDLKNLAGGYSPIQTEDEEDEEEDVREVIEISSGDERDEISRPREEGRPPMHQPGGGAFGWEDEFGPTPSHWFQQWTDVIRHEWIIKTRELAKAGVEATSLDFFSEIELQGIARKKREIETYGLGVRKPAEEQGGQGTGQDEAQGSNRN
ncbi:hypothetical protein CBR_g41700 [Chara braunii]|uniref:Integrase catalytic domain-containing protein n=1 Tax=Chara braunii TaxID=69332 RepID=A0A388LWD1_CHABU|nr:hypothetical protein CBR_g41700 [Chara braunii]|eukprot:GBG86637.1 hypothetical protein CBR_g41700 [Chara braunii]